MPWLEGSASDRIVRLMGSTSAGDARRQRPSFSAAEIGAGAIVAGGDVHIVMPPAGASQVAGFAKAPPVDRRLLIDLIELCGNQLGDRRHHLPHMVTAYGTTRMECLSDSALKDLADWAYSRAMGRQRHEA